MNIQSFSTFRRVFEASILAAIVAILSGVSVPAEARSQAAILGYPGHPSDPNCFDEHSGGPIQGCSTRQKWIIPIVYDRDGRMTIRVSAAGNGTKRVYCHAWTADSNGDSRAWSREASTVRVDRQPEHLTMTLGHAHGFGGVWLSCMMDPGTRLFNVHY